MSIKVKYAVLSITSFNAGEWSDEILARKINDVRTVGRTFWQVNSPLAMPDQVQNLCSMATQQLCNPLCLCSPVCIFYVPVDTPQPVNNADCDIAAEYSDDNNVWRAIPEGLGPVTGHLQQNSGALVIDEFIFRKCEIDLWDYAVFTQPEQPIKNRPGASTVCAIGKDTSTHPDRMQNNRRPVIAIGRLAYPYAVWVKR